MNRKFTCILLGAFLSFSTPAFTQEIRRDITSLKPYEITADQKDLQGSVTLNSFRRIRIVDMRFDTTKLGFIRDINSKKLVLKEGLENYLNTWAATRDKSETNPDLLIVLKTFWVQEVKAGEKYEDLFADEKQNISECRVRFDVYAYKDSLCQALIRVDTTFSDRKPVRYIAHDFLQQPFTYMLQKLQGLSLTQVLAQKRKITLSEVLANYKNRLDFPQLKNNESKQGIYLTFSDFLNNKISERKFSLDEDAEADYLYLEENGESKLFTEFWGFCDGGKTYVRIGHNFFPMTREQNTYQFWGCEQAIHRVKSRSASRTKNYMLFGVFGELHSTRLVNLLRPMQLDMDTGKPY